MTGDRGSDPAHTTPGGDAVLDTPPPGFTAESIVSFAAEALGIAASGATDLGSERDRTIMLVGSDGGRLAVLKISNAGEDPDTLDMELVAARHALRVDPDLPIALPRRIEPTDAGTDDPAAHRRAWTVGDTSHWVRVYDVIPGHGRVDPTTLDDRAVRAWGRTTARLGRALRGFTHERAHRTMLWDVQHAALLRPLVGTIRDERVRRDVERVFDRFDAVVAPAWPALRAQVVHGDLTVDNVLLADDGAITGIIDFGDMSHSALVIDVIAALDSLATGRSGDEVFRSARVFLDGYQGVTPLEDIELDLLGELWATRAAAGIAIAAWRAERGLEDRAFAERFSDAAHAVLGEFLRLGWEEVTRRIRSAGPARSAVAPLAERRSTVFGAAMEPLSYATPIHVESAEGTWIRDVYGRRYLDMYNNVPCVGHAHPRVTGAIAAQARRLNTNMRYLHGGAVELAERLVATCPPGLDTVLFVNSGSEANDVALRIANAATARRGVLCTTFAYHGITEATAAVSPETIRSATPPHVATFAPPDEYRRTGLGTADFEAALASLVDSPFGCAAVILDGVLQSDGVLVPEPAHVAALAERAKDAGALWIADEVQGGHGRTGGRMWSFERFGIVPDIVTLGKPMGNGHPVAAVITTAELAERFAATNVFFSTFGGNQVSVAAALAVLDVLDDERVLDRVTVAGDALRKAVRAIGAGRDQVGEVRGVGLANAIELVRDPSSKEPDGAAAAAVRDALRDLGVLVGTTGPAGNVVKVRPPLSFTADDVPVFTAALDQAFERVLR